MQPSRRPVAQILPAVGDGAAWAAGLGLATWARYAFEEKRISVFGLLDAVGVVVKTGDSPTRDATGEPVSLAGLRPPVLEQS